jgi:hypothetical protein
MESRIVSLQYQEKTMFENDDQSLEEPLAEFGQYLNILENPSLGAREVPFSKLVAKANAWFAAESATLHTLICTPTNAVKPEITASTTMLVIVASVLRAHYGVQFPSEAAANCLIMYGIQKFCAKEGGVSAKK